jgi:homoserine O-acetyltransferase
MKKIWQFQFPFVLESGDFLPELQLAYHTFGRHEPGKKVIWVCHALTANSDVSDWWEGLFGPGKILDPEQAFIVCANMPGSCYGSTSPLSKDPNWGGKYGKNFPFLSQRDIVRAFQLLKSHFQIEKIDLLLGGSMGGQQCLEWAIRDSESIENLVVLATNARHSAWGIAFNEAQRMALELGPDGIKAARAMAMLSYRNYAMFERTQGPLSQDQMEDFPTATYQRYQGEKLARRFDPDCYFTLSKAMDSHNLARGRDSLESALRQIESKTLVIGISSDILFPAEEQKFLAAHIPNAHLEIIDSDFGHDGFLTETEKINSLLLDWFLLTQKLKSQEPQLV